MEDFYDGWFEDDNNPYTDENGIPFWDQEAREDEYRAWENAPEGD